MSPSENAPDTPPKPGLEEALNRATELSGELVEEVGTEDASGSAGGQDPPGDAGAADAIDAQLDQLEESLANVQAEIVDPEPASAPPADQPEAEPAPPADQAEEGASSTTPADLSGEEPQASDDTMDFRSAAAALGTSEEIPDPADDLVETASAGETSGGPMDYKSAAESLGGAPPAPTEPSEKSPRAPIELGKKRPVAEPGADASNAVTQTQAPAAEFGIEFSEEDLGDLGGCPSFDEPASVEGMPVEEPPESAPAVAPSGRLAAVSNASCTILEMVDRPFGLISMRVRRVLGWVALAVLFAAVCVLVMSVV
ncbi:MAG: hypothetical protein GY842_08585 [bacterium]|nr:hypothetical protein [bacterium]